MSYLLPAIPGSFILQAFWNFEQTIKTAMSQFEIAQNRSLFRDSEIILKDMGNS